MQEVLTRIGTTIFLFSAALHTVPGQSLHNLPRIGLYANAGLMSDYGPIGSGNSVSATPTKPETRELRGGEKHIIPLPMVEGEFCSVKLDQHSIDIVVVLLDPDGKRIIEANRPGGISGAESIAFLARVTGEFRLEISALEPRARPGKYSIAVSERRQATRDDRIYDLAFRIAAAESDVAVDALIDAEQALEGIELSQALSLEGSRLRNTSAGNERILAVSLRSLRYAERLRDTTSRALAHRAVGLANANLDRMALGEQHLLTAASLFERTGNTGRHSLVLTLRDLASLKYKAAAFKYAIDLYEKAKAGSAALGDREGVVVAQNGIAACHLQLKQFYRAYEYLEASLSLTDGFKDPSLKLSTLSQLASTYSSQGRIGKAAEAYDRAFRTAEESGSRAGVAYLFQSAVAQSKLSNFPAAYSAFRKVMADAPQLGAWNLYIYSVLNIASIHVQRGELVQAVKVYERGVELLEDEISRTSSNARFAYIADRIETVNKLAEISVAEGDHQPALTLYSKNLLLLKATVSESARADRTLPGEPDSYAILEVLINKSIGELHSMGGNYKEAALYLETAKSLAERSGYESGAIDSLISLATNAARNGDHPNALQYVNTADSIANRTGRLDQLLKIRIILANVHRKFDRPVAADLAYQEAIRISESLRSDVTLPDQRASYFARLFAPFDEYIDFLMDRHAKQPDAGFDNKAFNISERRRARALLDSLKAARADIRHGVEPGLLERERYVRNQLNAAARQQFTDLGSDPSMSRPGEDALRISIAAPKTDIPALSAELQRVETAIRKQSPRYAELTQPRPLRSNLVQELLDDNTILLNYTLGEKRSYLWVVSKAAVTSYVLPPRAEIEESVKKVYAFQSDGDAVEEDPSASQPAGSEYLSRVLLGPAAASFGDKKLVVVADGALQYLPFSSLPDPRRMQSAKVPMLLSNEILSTPSASVVAVLRQELKDRTPAPNSVAIFADPVFSEDDERLSADRNERQVAEPLESNSRDRGLFLPRLSPVITAGKPYHIPRLPFSGREANSIFESAQTGTPLKAVDFEASRETLERIDLSTYKIVHFATHGILQSEYPELSGVVLSLVNKKGEPVDGFLRLHEIYNLKLNADLVVLSACQTALGKEVHGEGLVGLTRGFMYAGSPRVVASLWKVDDVATAELMKRFYAKMLKENMRPAAALRAAKIEMMNQERWSEPYYWAAFEIQGEWR